jgi:hypothetical protein
MGRSPNPANRGPEAPIPQQDRMAMLLAELKAETNVEVPELAESLALVGENETFRAWCERLGREGLKVDGKPFSLAKRPAMAWLYDQFPSTQEECFRRTLVLMKCAQVGFTVMEILASIYIGLKFPGATVGMFLPDQNLANIKSAERFMPVVRSMPKVHERMVQDDEDAGSRRSPEGSLNRRRIGSSLYVFSWTSGRATTESIPMDFLLFDEVQEMTREQLDKTRERLSASEYRYTLMGSTANWPDDDIHYWYNLGTRHAFHTRCPTCDKMRPLVDYFPDCIRYDERHPNDWGEPGAHRYVCEDGHWIDDPQDGEWIAANPDAKIVSAHFPQMLSPTISADEIMEKYRTASDLKNFNNRVLGRPYLDPRQTPVTLAHMNACVAAGAAAGVKWKKRSQHAFMGVDQMGNYNVVVLKERLDDGRYAVIHLEEIYAADPFDRCSELMQQYGVKVAVVELNPNYNDAKKFANRHSGRVFICNSFGTLTDDMLSWGDTARLDSSDRRTEEQARDRYTVRLDQFKCMQTSMGLFTAKEPLCLFPNPMELQQEVIEKGGRRMSPVAPRAFLHFTKTALVTERDEETNQYKKYVRKIGLDPHFSYANMLCDVALARAHGTSTFILPQQQNASRRVTAEAIERNLPGLPPAIAELMVGPSPDIICSRCISYSQGDGDVSPLSARCDYTGWTVAGSDVGCDMFVSGGRS